MAQAPHVPVLGKAIRLVEALASGTASGSIAKLAGSLGIPTTTCFRIIKTLTAAGWVRARSEGGYELSVGLLLRLLEPLMGYRRLIEIARGPMARAAHESGLTVKLTVREADEAVTAFRTESPHPTAVAQRVGARFPVVAGASGSVLMSGLDDTEVDRLIHNAVRDSLLREDPEVIRIRIADVRQTDICQDFGGYHPQIYGFSGAIRDPQQRVVAAATVLGLPHDFDSSSTDRYRGVLERLREECTERVSAEGIRPAGTDAVRTSALVP